MVGFLLFAVSCKKTDSDNVKPGNVNEYPKDVNITYRVSSTTTNQLDLITYGNETGGQTSINNIVLPYEKTITKKVNKYNIITLGYFVNPAQTIKLEIFVNNQLVKSNDYISSNSSMSYTFQ